MWVDYFRTVGREEQSKKATFGGKFCLVEVDTLPTVAGLRCKPRPAASRPATALFAHSECCLFFLFYQPFHTDHLTLLCSRHPHFLSFFPADRVRSRCSGLDPSPTVSARDPHNTVLGVSRLVLQRASEAEF